jgi:hypothetical protein
MALVGTNGQGVGTSPFSEWVKKVSELELAADEKQQLELFIDKLYEDLNEGGTASTTCYFLRRHVACKMADPMTFSYMCLLCKLLKIIHKVWNIPWYCIL